MVARRKHLLPHLTVGDVLRKLVSEESSSPSCDLE